MLTVTKIHNEAAPGLQPKPSESSEQMGLKTQPNSYSTQLNTSLQGSEPAGRSNKLSAFPDRLEASLEATNDSIKKPLNLKLGNTFHGNTAYHPRPQKTMCQRISNDKEKLEEGNSLVVQ